MAWRLLAAGCATGAAFGLWLLGALPAAMAGQAVRWRSCVMRGWSRVMARIIGMRIQVHGSPPPVSLLVSNHLSYVDILLLGATTGNTFVSKAEVADWPVIGFLAGKFGTLFLRREHKRDLLLVARQMEQSWAAGQGLCLFPEGTSSPGAETLPFRSSLLEPAAAAALPVGYAALRYTTPPGAPPAHLAVCWWGEMTLAPHLLTLLRMPHFEASVAFGPEPIVESDRKLLAARLHDAVRELFRPTMESSEVCLTTLS